MIRILILALGMVLAPAAGAEGFRLFASYTLKSHFKITGDRITPIPMKPVVLRVFTDGVRVRVAAAGDDEAATSYDIYRSDGIGRRRSGKADLDVVPGVQAMTSNGGVLRHLRLTRDALTITTFPGVSDQTIVTHAVVVVPSASLPAAEAPAKPVPSASQPAPKPLPSSPLKS